MADTYSEPSTIQSVSFDVGEWVLVDYEAPEDNLFLSVAMEALVYENPQDVGVNFPLPAAGATSPIYPVVELSAAHKATRFLLTVDFLGDEGFETLKRHRAKNRTLLLQSPQGDQWWF